MSDTGRKAVSQLRQPFSGGLLMVPALFVLGSLLLATLTVVSDEWLSGVVPEAILFRGDSDSGRAILTSIAGAAITLTGLVFTVTMLVLQLAGSQYSPRSVGALLKDRTAKFTLGVFVGTFTYSLAVLRTIDPVENGFDRGISVAVGVLLGLVTVGFFVNYVNHVTLQIRPSSIIGNVATEAETAIDDYLVEEEQPQAPLPPTVPPDRIIPAPAAGTVRSIAIDVLVRKATDDDLTIRMIPAVGEFVPRGAPLMHVWGTLPDDRENHEGGDGRDEHDHLDRQVTLGSERDLRSDPRYGLRQLVDIAERALSPGINDPTTATQAIDRIHDLLRRVVCRNLPNGAHTDDDGRVRLIVPEPRWEDLLDLGVDEIAHYGEDSIQVGERLTVMLRDLLDAAPPERAPSIVRKLVEIERPA